MSHERNTGKKQANSEEFCLQVAEAKRPVKGEKIVGTGQRSWIGSSEGSGPILERKNALKGFLFVCLMLPKT